MEDGGFLTYKKNTSDGVTNKEKKITADTSNDFQKQRLHAFSLCTDNSIFSKGFWCNTKALINVHGLQPT